MFVNDLCRHWEVVSPGDSRNPNHILGLVCRNYYLDIITYKGTIGPAKLWDHYKSAPMQIMETSRAGQERVLGKSRYRLFLT
jgi:hypothetical protein